MRFRFGEGEEQLFVADILPLLDIEDEDIYTSSSGDLSTDSSDVIKLHTSCQCADELQMGKLIPSSRSRLRIRGKIDHLRREIQTLGVDLADLQRTGRKMAASADTRAATSRWKNIAIKNKQLRLRAEHDNKVLKRMIAAQHTLAKSILDGRFRLSGIRCAVKSSPHRRFPRINV